jgi:2-C-methyl-D-erythritol 4-phosphate cytidylyltransferase
MDSIAEAAVAETAVAVVICAAGTSARMGGIKKEYCLLPGANGLTVLAAAVWAFASIPEIKNIIITVPTDPINGRIAAQKALQPITDGECSPALHFIDGGATRQASVFSALSMLAAGQNIQSPDFVLIHDGARPWLSASLIKRIITEVKKNRAVIPLLPLTETPKETDVPLDDSNASPVFIKQHLKRAFIGGAQTPQGFAFPEIFTAHQQAAKYSERSQCEFTDDAEIWASFCGPVAAIPGDSKNRKITFPEDLC